MSKVCNFCSNKNFKKKSVQYIYRHNENFLVVDNVPCEECEFCGEQYFKSSVLKNIEEDYKKLELKKKKPLKLISVPFENFPDIATA